MRYSVSSLMLVIFAASVVVALWSNHLHRESQIERGVEMLGSFDVSAYRYDTDPRLLIRIVNHFYDLGHRDSIEGLRRFANRFVREDTIEHLDTLDVIVPLLYLPKEENSKLPDWDWGKSNKSYKLNRDSWGTTIHELNGIPFEIEFRGRGGSGYQIAHLYLIEWAECDAKLRAAPLRPIDDPFADFERSVSLVVNLEYFRPCRENNTGTESSVTRRMRSQIYFLVSELVGNSEIPAPDEWIPSDENWTKLKTNFDSRPLLWNTEEQSYFVIPNQKRQRSQDNN